MKKTIIAAAIVGAMASTGVMAAETTLTLKNQNGQAFQSVTTNNSSYQDVSLEQIKTTISDDQKVMTQLIDSKGTNITLTFSQQKMDDGAIQTWVAYSDDLDSTSAACRFDGNDPKKANGVFLNNNMTYVLDCGYPPKPE